VTTQVPHSYHTKVKKIGKLKPNPVTKAQPNVR
jgi:hypothetical protein